jgi:AmmeMemoRadiSam system protein A
MMDKTLQASLLKIAAQSIKYGLEYGQAQPVDHSKYDDALRNQVASFVTLTIAGALRGCIGSLEAYRPLVEDVAHNAFAAAFRDPRFTPLSASEYSLLHYHISILGKAEAILLTSEQALLEELQPGVDGLIIEDGRYRATFLPSVWESLPEPEEFLYNLKRKAGLTEAYWSETLTVKRYQVESFGEDIFEEG